MKLFSRKPLRSVGEALPASGFTTRQVTAMVVAVSLAVVLSPVGARAASLLGVVITDPAGTNKAHVDASGNLQVGGTVNAQQSGNWNVGLTGGSTVGIASSANTVKVDSGTPVSVSSADDPGREAFQKGIAADIVDGHLFAHGFFTVPAGKRLVIRYVSGKIVLPPGQRAVDVFVITSVNGSLANHFVVPVFTASSSGTDISEFAQETQLYADPGPFDVEVGADRSDSTGAGTFDIVVSGYLIDCSVAPCN